MELALETRSLRKMFGALVAVDGIDLAVPTGSFYGFLGPNGAGKSTTIKCLTGLLEPSSGEMRILGIDPIADAVAVKKRIGVVPEDLALFDRLSGAETLAFVGRVHGLDAGTLRARSTELLELMSLAEASGDLVADYSHGMRKKIALAAALLPGPRMLFLDEPFEGIDAVASRQIKELLS
jgi:ABC-2 type transport system ATP-binding protein